MKNKLLLMSAIVLLWFNRPFSAFCQSQETQQLLLNVEKLAQFKNILADMKQGYQVIANGYNAVCDLSEGNFSLHKTFLDQLLKISPVVSKYHMVAGILSAQSSLLQEYKSALKSFNASSALRPDQLSYISSVYHNLGDRSLDNLADLLAVLTAGQLRMSDQERLTAIDRLYDKSIDQLNFLRRFSVRYAKISGARASEARQLENLKTLTQ